MAAGGLNLCPFVKQNIVFLLFSSNLCELRLPLSSNCVSFGLWYFWLQGQNLSHALGGDEASCPTDPSDHGPKCCRLVHASYTWAAGLYLEKGLEEREVWKKCQVRSRPRLWAERGSIKVALNNQRVATCILRLDSHRFQLIKMSICKDTFSQWNRLPQFNYRNHHF